MRGVEPTKHNLLACQNEQDARHRVKGQGGSVLPYMTDLAETRNAADCSLSHANYQWREASSNQSPLTLITCSITSRTQPSPPFLLEI